ncbi:protein NRT1/ PTR FAMILY 2.8 [Fagus crenata]
MENVTHSTVSIEQDPPLTSTGKAGGWKSVKYIIGNESFEKLAAMSLIANMTVYLITKYNLSGLFVVNIVTIWNGSSNIATLAGAFIADAYLGRFRTLVFGSISSLLGIGIMTLTAAIHQLRPSACNGQSNCPHPQWWQLAVLFIALTFLSLGAGGIRPCNIAFGADQFDIKTKKGRAQLESFFNWWYFSFTIALIVALTVVVYIQTNVSWVIGFAIPTACLFVSITIFFLGCHTYIYKNPQGSIFSDIVKVIIAACWKHRLTVGPASEYSFYDPTITGSESPTLTKLAHTDRFKVLDKAAIIADPSELDNQGIAKNGWRLCSLQQVEQLKCLVAILPVWLSGIGCFIVMDQQGTFGILQVIQMERSIGPHFKIPPGWMGLTSMIALSIWILIYERVYIPQAKKMTSKDKRLTMRQRISTGIVMSILCMVVAGIVEKIRRDSALKHGSFTSPTSFALILPQFVLSGLTEAFAAVAVMEFFTTQMPESMRTTAGAVFFLSLSIASYLSSLIINVIHEATTKSDKSSWLGGHDLNYNRLDYYYYIIAALQVLNFVYFDFFASRYVLISGVGCGRKETQLESSIAGHPRNLSECEPNEEEKSLEMHV